MNPEAASDDRRLSRLAGWMFGILLVVHAGLSLNAARRLSPVWDEIVYPAAGLAQWRTGRVAVNLEHPFLSKLIAAMPLRFLPLEVPVPEPADARGGFRYGYRFTFQQAAVVPPRQIIFWSRVPMLLFSILSALILFLWLRAQWGPFSGLISAACYLSTPILAARAGLALLEMPMYCFLLLALASHWLWNENRDDRWILAAGAAAGLALLAKASAVVVVPTLLAVHFSPDGGPLRRDRFWSFGKFLAALAATLLIVLLPCKDSLGWFRDIFLYPFQATQSMPAYWHGRLVEHPSLWVRWAAWWVKAPPAVLGLGLLGAFAWRRSGRQRAGWTYLAVFAFFSALPSLLGGSVISTVHLSPIYLALAALAGGMVALTWDRGKVASVVVLLLVLAAGDCYRCQPDLLSYFNPFSGGASQGYHWLADSDQDWGQGLGQLAEELARRGKPNVLLSYSGPGDPRAWGIRYQDLLSPALVTAEYRGEPIHDDPRPVLVALSTKVLQSEPALTGWLVAHRQPLRRVGNCFILYDVTADPEAFRWIGVVYVQTQRPSLARWAFARAAQLDPGNPENARLRALLTARRHGW